MISFMIEIKWMYFDSKTNVIEEISVNRLAQIIISDWWIERTDWLASGHFNIYQALFTHIVLLYDFFWNANTFHETTKSI